MALPLISLGNLGQKGWPKEVVKRVGQAGTKFSIWAALRLTAISWQTRWVAGGTRGRGWCRFMPKQSKSGASHKWEILGMPGQRGGVARGLETRKIWAAHRERKRVGVAARWSTSGELIVAYFEGQSKVTDRKAPTLHKYISFCSD